MIPIFNADGSYAAPINLPPHTESGIVAGGPGEYSQPGVQPKPILYSTTKTLNIVPTGKIGPPSPSIFPSSIAGMNTKSILVVALFVILVYFFVK